MPAFDLQQIGSVAPRRDLVAGLTAPALAALLARAAFLPKLFAASPVRARRVLGISVLGCAAVVTILAMMPRHWHAACFTYGFGFTLLEFATSHGLADRFRLRRRAAFGGMPMLAAAALSWWLACAPR